MQTASIIFLGILCLIPVIAVWFAARLAWSRLRRGESQVSTLYRLSRFIRYFHTLYLFPLMFISLDFGLVLAWSIHPRVVQYFVAVVVAVLWFVIIKCAYVLITFKLRKQIYESSQSRLQSVAATAAQAVATASVYAVMFYVVAILPQSWVRSHGWIIGAGIAAYFAIISFLAAELAPLFMRAKLMPPQEVPDTWLQAMEQTSVPSVQFYLWPTRKNRILNAMATGFFRKKIIVADYLLDTMTDEQAMAVVFHELGHHRYRHLWWGLLLIICWIPIVQAWNQLTEHSGVPIGLGAFLAILGLGAYYGLLVKWVSRRFEFQADAFAVQFTGQSLPDSLEKLTEENKSPRDISRFDELWMTHPSMARRIRQAEKRCQT